ncbi:MAG: glycosyltransferase family 1 protein [Betaproteobacteria bacterium]
MRILLATDAWAPQVNGVVNTLRNTVDWLGRFGHEVEVITPRQFRTVPMPTYPEIRLAVAPGSVIRQRIEAFAPDAVHISTEGPIGLAARRCCLARGLRFSTAYHTRFPEYISARTGLPPGAFYPLMRWFHGASSSVMVGTPALRDELEQRGLRRLRDWSRGVDTSRFHPAKDRRAEPGGPVFLYAGRVAVEKNIETFLALDLPGRKVVVGDGPARESLQRKFPAVEFAGMKTGDELVAFYQRADVFVFPSLTDTFGLVMLEALACGTPVAAFPVSGPIDVIKDPAAGVLDADLRTACLAALQRDRGAARAYAERFSWERCSRQFESNLVASRGHWQQVAVAGA